MKQKLRTSFAFIAALLVLNGILFACGSKKTATFSQYIVKSERANLEKISRIPSDKVTCKNGGETSSFCSIAPGIKLGDIVTIGCSVTCNESTYACCGERCICRPITKS